MGLVNAGSMVGSSREVKEMQNVWLWREAVQILVVRRTEKSRGCRNIGTGMSDGGCDTNREDK